MDVILTITRILKVNILIFLWIIIVINIYISLFLWNNYELFRYGPNFSTTVSTPVSTPVDTAVYI